MREHENHGRHLAGTAAATESRPGGSTKASSFSAGSVRQRLRISLVFVIFEGGMPLIALGLGTALARGIGHVATYLAAAAVTTIGAWMLLAGDKDEEETASRFTTSRGLALIALGISIRLVLTRPGQRSERRGDSVPHPSDENLKRLRHPELDHHR